MPDPSVHDNGPVMDQIRETETETDTDNTLEEDSKDVPPPQQQPSIEHRPSAADLIDINPSNNRTPQTPTAVVTTATANTQTTPPILPSSPSLPPATARTQPTGFPSPHVTSINNTAQIQILSDPFNPDKISYQNGIGGVPSTSFSPSRFLSAFHSALRHVQHTTQHSTTTQQHSEESTTIHATLAAFKSLSPAAQADCLHALLSDGQLLNELINHFLSPAAGQANDALCRWMYEIYWAETHTQTDNTNTAAVRPVPAAVIFILHLVPILVFSFLYRTTRALPAPGIAAVLLAVYHAQKQKTSMYSNKTNSILNPAQLVHTIYGSPNLTLPSSFSSPIMSPFSPTSRSSSSPSSPSSPSPSSPTPATTTTTALPVPLLSDLTPTNVSALVHSVLVEYINCISLMCLSSQQQFCYLCTILVANNTLVAADRDETQNTLNNFHFNWNTQWEQRLSHAYKKLQNSRKHRGHGGGSGTSNSGSSSASSGGEDMVDDETSAVRASPRYQLSVDLLHDLLIGLIYCAQYPGTKQLALSSLREIHCRAVEELMPEILLQTTAVLEQVDE